MTQFFYEADIWASLQGAGGIRRLDEAGADGEPRGCA